MEPRRSLQIIINVDHIFQISSLIAILKKNYGDSKWSNKQKSGYQCGQCYFNKVVTGDGYLFYSVIRMTDINNCKIMTLVRNKAWNLIGNDTLKLHSSHICPKLSMFYEYS